MATSSDEDLPLEGTATAKISAGQKFPEELSTVLERLYAGGMTGWGKDHAS